MKLSTFFISLLLTITTVGQSFAELKQDLSDRDFISLKRMVDKLPSKYTLNDTPYALSGKWLTLRDITPEFQEAVIELEDSYAIENQKGSRAISEYKLSVISTNSEIVKYNLAKMQMTFIKSESRTQIDWQPIDSFFNSQMVDSFKTSYKRLYKAQLRLDDLTVDDNVVGYGCGYSGEAPELMSQMIKILDKKSYNELDNWLRSANIEKQVYAVIALHNLKKKGRKITEEQKGLINLIRNKQGKVKLCRGCSYLSDNIGDVVNRVLAGRGI